MNKKIIALAIASISGVAFAQSNVTISGIADVGIEVGNSGFGSKTRVQSGQSQGNRLAFQGKEKINSDVEVFFILEAGYTMDNGQASNNGSLTQNAMPATTAGPIAGAGGPSAAGTNNNAGVNVASTGSGSYLFQRQSVLGLKTSFGGFMLGRQYSPMEPIRCAYDSSNCGTVASMGHAATTGIQGYAARFDNAMSYMIEMNGFSGALAYSSGAENNQTTFGTPTAGVGEKDGKAWGMNLKYANGPVSVGWAYHNTRPMSALRAAATVEDSAKAWLLGGSYDFSTAKVFANYSAGKLENANFNGANGSRLSDRRAWALGVSMPFGAHSVRLNLGKNDDRLTADQDFSFWGVHYEYAMSKRTAFYGAYAILNNANRGTAAAPTGAGMSLGNTLASNMTVGGSQGGNYDPSALQLGVRHSF